MSKEYFKKSRQFFETAIKPSFIVTASKRIIRAKLTRSRKIGVAGLCSIIFGVIFQTVIFQYLLELQIKKKTALKKGSPMRETWSKLPFPWELHVYLFNVTNPEKIASGEKPKVAEVGPFVYDVWQEKTKQVDYEDDDTLSYSTKNTYFFNADKSHGLSDDEEVILPHFISLGIANGVMKVIPMLLPLAEKIVDSVLKNPESVFVKMKAKMFLFDGYGILCDKPKDFFEAGFCNQIKKHWFDYHMKKKDNLYMVSMYGSLNGTDIYSGKIRLRRGTKNVNEVGDLVEYNDKKNMTIWENDECDAFVGTDGTIFHPFLHANRKDLYITNTFYCRAFTYRYDSEIEFSGLQLLRYSASLGSDVKNYPNEKCYCTDSDHCLKSGVYELWRCLNTVRIASNPHFYLADPYYSDAVEGLQPSKEKHMTILDIDPLTGLAVRAHFRIQFNLMLTKLKKYRLMKDFPEALLPVMWADEVTVLPEFILKKIATAHKVVNTATVFAYLIILKGLGMCSYAAFCDYRSRKKRQTTVQSVALTSKGNALDSIQIKTESQPMKMRQTLKVLPITT